MADTADGKIIWTEDERTLLTLEIIKIFESKKLPVEEWLVTVHSIMKAQYALFEENRCRAYMPTYMVDELQGRVQAYVNEDIKKKDVAIVLVWRDFVKLHACSPIDRIAQLEQKISSLRATVERTGNDRPTAPEAPHWPASVKATLPPNRVIDKLQQVGTTGDVKGDLRLLLVNPGMPQIARALLNIKGVDVVWSDRNDDGSKLRNLANGRHVFLHTGMLGSNAVRALKERSLSFTEVPGGNSAFSTIVNDFINANT